MNILGILAFLAGLAGCVVTGVNLLWALGLGLAVFSALALRQAHSLAAVGRMWLEGARTVANILIIFLLIGMLTAIWRASGTIAQLIVWVLPLVEPQTFALWVFLLCSGVSLLLGTSFGTASTVGVIFMALARSAGLNELLIGGAILSGIYVGDRCSPMSSSAALVCAVTHTAIYHNIRGMWRTSFLPLLLAGLGYWMLARLDAPARVDIFAVTAQLEGAFRLNGWCIVPAAVVAVLSLARVEVKRVMLVSILTGCAVCHWQEGMAWLDVLATLCRGYRPASGQMMAGGGMQSMLAAAGIVLLSAPYVSLFRAARLLDGIERGLRRLSARIGAFRSTALVSGLLSMLCCNQMLTVLMSAQTCRELFGHKRDWALALENSAILFPALVPWNIAAAVPCSILEVDTACLFWALYPVLTPAVNMLLPERFSLAVQPGRGGGQ